MDTNAGALPQGDRAGGLCPEPAAQSQPEALIPSASVLKRWRVSVRGFSEPMSGVIVAASRGAALADAWRNDIFNGYLFGEFLRIARAYRETEPTWWGAQITVLGKPAFYYGRDSQYVHFAYPGCKFTNVAHPYDVEPVQYRPEAYRTAQAIEAGCAPTTPEGDS